MRSSRLAFRVATALLVFLAGVALLAPVLTAPDTELQQPGVRHDPHRVDLAQRLLPPSSSHWLGTDELGRDVLARMIHGTRVSLVVGVAAAALSLIIGVVIGSLAGYFGGVVDWICMRLIELALCFPFFFLVLTIVTVAGPSLPSIILALAVSSWTAEARFVRGEMMRVKETAFAEAARAGGAGELRILVQHLLPHAVAPALVSAGFGVATAILGESALSFLGFGVQMPQASWGSILSTADDHLGRAWWLALFPGMAIFLTVAAVNVIADHARARLRAR